MCLGSEWMYKHVCLLNFFSHVHMDDVYLYVHQKHDHFLFHRFNGIELPLSAQVDGNILTITNPQLSDAGNYICFSKAGKPDEASFTFSLSVIPVSLIPSASPTLTPTLNDSSQGQ